jgi:hypothetical protein
MAESARSPLSEYYPMLASGNTGGLSQLIADGARIDDPIWGSVTGASDLSRYFEQAGAWLTDRDALVEHVAQTSARGRVVDEAVLRLQHEGKEIGLPVALVADVDAEGKARWIRIYHSTWPLTGGHRVRPPMLPGDPALRLSDVVADYHEALQRGELGTITRLFDAGGYVREPSGDPYVYQGTERIGHVYAALFSNGGGIKLEHCSATDDGTRCALEYNVLRWGRTKLTPQAGVGVYERGRSGLLSAARIYDDVDPPMAG